MDLQPGGSPASKNLFDNEARTKQLIVLITLLYPLLIIAGLAFAIYVAGH